MNARQERQFKMFLATNLVLTRNESLWKSKPTFASVQQIFQEKVLKIQEASKNQVTTHKGQTESKKKKKQELAQIAAQVAAALESYGLSSRNLELQRQAEYTQSVLLNKSDTELCTIVRKIQSLTTGIETNLNEFFVESNTLKTLQKNLDDFEMIIPAAKVDKGQTQTSREEFTTLIQQANTLLKEELDTLIKTFAKPHPVFYKEYRMARKLPGGGNSGKKNTPDTKTTPT